MTHMSAFEHACDGWDSDATWDSDVEGPRPERPGTPTDPSLWSRTEVARQEESEQQPSFQERPVDDLASSVSDWPDASWWHGRLAAVREALLRSGELLLTCNKRSNPPPRGGVVFVVRGISGVGEGVALDAVEEGGVPRRLMLRHDMGNEKGPYVDAGEGCRFRRADFQGVTLFTYD